MVKFRINRTLYTGSVRNADRIWVCTPQNCTIGVNLRETDIFFSPVGFICLGFLLGCFCGFLQHLCRYILPEALNPVGVTSIETSLLYRCRPYGAEGLGSHAYYIDTVPTGLKRFLKYPRFSRKIRFGWNADRIWVSTPRCTSHLGEYAAKTEPTGPGTTTVIFS